MGGKTNPIRETGVSTVPQRPMPSLDATTEPGPEGRGARHPKNKPNTRSCLVGLDVKENSVATKRAVPSCANYVLTSYAAWWHRMEKDTSRFYKDVIKEESMRKSKQQERERKKKKTKGRICKEVLSQLRKFSRRIDKIAWWG